MYFIKDRLNFFVLCPLIKFYRPLIIIILTLAVNYNLTSCTSTARFSKTRSRIDVSQKQNVKREKNTAITKRGDLWQTATGWLGVPYRYGGTNRSGIDCSALAGHIYREAYGIDLPRTVADILKGGKAVHGQNFEKGDLLFFKNTRTGPVDHVGVYLGEGRFIHASTSSGVIISDSDNGLYRQRLITVRRYER